MTPEHKFELVRTIISIVPATILSAWALIHQLRQTRARLEVLISPVFAPTIIGNDILTEDWPGVAVRNQSGFSLRVSNVGLRIGNKFFTFGKPLAGDLKPVADWPFEVQPRTRMALYLDTNTLEGRRSIADTKPNIPKGKAIWQIARAYAMTECGRTFTSPRLSRRTLAILLESRTVKPDKLQEAV